MKGHGLHGSYYCNRFRLSLIVLNRFHCFGLFIMARFLFAGGNCLAGHRLRLQILLPLKEEKDCPNRKGNRDEQRPDERGVLHRNEIAAIQQLKARGIHVPRSTLPV